MSKPAMIFAHRFHDFSYGHKVTGHESCCARLHGHNGRVTFHCAAPQLDGVGRVIDFSVIKHKLCQWVEDNWDHFFLINKDDPIANGLVELDHTVIKVGFNPTAENMAQYLLDVVGPQQLAGTEVTLVRVDFMETIKCGVTVERHVSACSGSCQ